MSIGMTKPEMRRLKKFYKKECPQGKLEKFKRVSDGHGLKIDQAVFYCCSLRKCLIGHLF